MSLEQALGLPSENTITTRVSSSGWSPDRNGKVETDKLNNALLLSASTRLGEIEGDAPVIRVPYVDDSTAVFTTEGDEIENEPPQMSEVEVRTAKIAHLVRLSNEQAAQPNAIDGLTQSVFRSIVRTADKAFVAQAENVEGKIAPPPGLQNIEGIIEGEPVTNSLDALIDLLAELEGNNSAPSHILLSPSAWGTLRKVKTGTGSQESLLGAGTTDAQQFLLGIPVHVTPALGADQGLIVDKNAVVSAYGDPGIDISHEAYFTSDALAIRATWRIGWNVVKPERIGKFTVSLD